MKINRVKTSLLVALCTTSLIGLSAPAMAQEAGADSSTIDDPSEITVSARRRDESLQDTPIAITAINASQLEAKGTVNIGDLMGAAPNLLITNQNSGGAAANLAIRGLTYADVEKSQEPTVGVVVDGVFIGTSTGQFFDFFDIDQIEVLRGPQGTLFGRNTIGGVISIKRTRPTGRFGLKAEASYGSFGTMAARAVMNVPLIDSQFAAKFFYFHNESDGFYRSGVTGKRVGGSNNDNMGVSFLVQPAGSGFDAVLTVEKQSQKFDVVNSNITNSSELFCGFITPAECNRNNTSDLYTVFNSPGVSNYSAPAVTLEMNYDLGGVKLTSVSGFRRSHENQTQDFDASTTDLYYTRRQQNYRQWSQELRAAGKVSDSFDYVVGGYLFSSRFDLKQHTRLFAFNTAVDPLIADTNPQLVIGHTKSFAIFGDFNWAFADKFRLSFGGRYTRDKKSLSNGFGGVLVGQGTGTFSKFTPKVGLDYRPNEDTMIYASWSRGYRSGGFSPRAATAITASVAYQPEVVDSYEVGTKLDLLDRHLQFNLAAFYSKYDGLQQNTTIPGGPTGNQTITSNAGSATIKGIEADFTARPAEGLRLTGSIGYLKSNFKGFVVGNTLAGVIRNFDYSSNDMIYSPNITASLGADYTLQTNFGSVIANIGYRYIAPYDQQISLGALTIPASPTGTVIVNGNDPRVRSDRQGLLDASLSAKFNLGGAKAKVTVFGRNLADDRGTTAAFTVAGLWSFASAREPRSFGASLGFEF
jgi:iron complex outermembrane recepter protein